jgi:hypothetical protein
VVVLLIGTTYLLVPLISPQPWIDVMVYYDESAEALLGGANPYNMTFTNIYYPSTLFYPSGEATYYPYPPVTFVIGLVGTVLGDARWMLIGAHLLAGYLLFLTGRARNLAFGESLMVAILFLYLPAGLFIVENGWTEPTVVLALAGSSYLLSRDRYKKFAWLAGVVLALKQTMVVYLMLLLGFWRKSTPKWLPFMLVTPALTYGAFFIWNPRALTDDLVIFHLTSPFRPDGLTIGSWLYREFGLQIPSWVALFPLVLVISLGIYRLSLNGGVSRIYDTGRIALLWCSFATVYLLTLLVSKHAFANYYYFFHFLVVLSLLWSRLADNEFTGKDHA